MYALSIADKYVRCGEAKRALVIGAETLSRITDWSDRSTAILFADGAGAVVLEPSETAGILSTHLHADGRYHEMLYCGSGVSRGFEPNLRSAWRARECSRSPSPKLGAVVDETLAANGLDRTAIDWLVPHQANIRIVEATASKLDLPLERVIITVQDHGNTQRASVPLALDVGVRTAASGAGTCCCWRPSAAASPGVRRSCATEAFSAPESETPRRARRFAYRL